MWVAVSVLVVCCTFGLWWRRVEAVMLQRMRPTSAMQVALMYNTYVDRLLKILARRTRIHERAVNNDTAKVTDIVILIDRLIPLADRYLAIVEKRNEPKPPPPDYGPVPDDLVAEALKESEPWARASVIQHFNELAQKHHGDWTKVRGAVMPTLDVHG